MGRKAWLDGSGGGGSCCVKEIAHISIRVKVTKALRGEWGGALCKALSVTCWEVSLLGKQPQQADMGWLGSLSSQCELEGTFPGLLVVRAGPSLTHSICLPLSEASQILTSML